MKEVTKMQNKQQGFSLLESLMALFVLTIGLLGVAGMNAQSMRTGYVAAQRMVAISKGEELIERIRANPAGIDSYDDPAVSYSCTSTAVCIPAEMAADDLFIWEDEVDKAFPGTPTVDIQVLNNVGALLDVGGVVREVTISISWVSRGDNYNHTAVTEVISTAVPVPVP